MTWVTHRHRIYLKGQNGPRFIANWNIKQSYDFNKVPGGAGDWCGRITYIRNMKKYKREKVLTNFGSRHKSSYLGIFTSRNCEGIPNSKFTTNCKKWKTEFSFWLWRENLLWLLLQGTANAFIPDQKKPLYDHDHNLKLYFWPPLELDFSITLVDDY